MITISGMRPTCAQKLFRSGSISKTYSSVETFSTLPRKLEGKVAIITGGASGIGAETARLFASHGANVIIADVNEKDGKQVSEELGSGSQYVRCDVSNEQDVANCVEFAVSTYQKLDIMFNNAGVVCKDKAEQAFTSILDTEASVFEHVHNVNVKGTLFGVKHSAKAMISSKDSDKVILNMCSIAAVVAQRTYHNYAISKHAILGITKTAASELGKHGIRVNCISPSGIVTPLVAQVLKTLSPNMSIEEIMQAYVVNSELAGRKLEMEDVANAALFLCSRDSKYISGHNLVLDGGLSASKPFNPFKNPYE